MKPRDAVFLAAETIPFGSVIVVPRAATRGARGLASGLRAVVARDGRRTRIAAVALMFGGLGCLVGAALGYAAAL